MRIEVTRYDKEPPPTPNFSVRDNFEITDILVDLEVEDGEILIKDKDRHYGIPLEALFGILNYSAAPPNKEKK